MADLSKYTDDELNKLEAGDYSVLKPEDIPQKEKPKAGISTKLLQAVSLPFEVTGESVRLAREGKPLSEFEKPSLFGGHPSDISQEIARGYGGIGSLMTGQGIEKAAEEVKKEPNPLATMAYGLMTPLPAGKAATIGSELKNIKSLKPEIEASKMIAGKLQNSSLVNLGNKFVNKVAHSPNLAAKAETLVDEAANSFKTAYNNIRKIQNRFYENAGITDELPVNVNNALSNMKTKLVEYGKTAIGTADEKAILEANKILTDISSKAKNGTLTFGQLKKMKSTLYSIGDSHVNELGRQTPIGGLFKDMGSELVEAQKSIPQIEKAGDKYKDLLEAEDLMEHASRLDRYTGEMNLAKKIKNRYTDIGNQDWKDTIAKAEEIFKRHPESKEFADFGDKIKAAHLALDVKAAKAVTPQGLGRIAPLKYLANAVKIFNPQFQINMLARGIKRGVIKPEAVAGKVIESQAPIGGTTLTRARALKSILNLEKPKKAVLPTAMGLRALLNTRGDTNGSTESE